MHKEASKIRAAVDPRYEFRLVCDSNTPRRQTEWLGVYPRPLPRYHPIGYVLLRFRFIGACIAAAMRDGFMCSSTQFNAFLKLPSTELTRDVANGAGQRLLFGWNVLLTSSDLPHTRVSRLSIRCGAHICNDRLDAMDTALNIRAPETSTTKLPTRTACCARYDCSFGITFRIALLLIPWTQPG
jgi:hypothetical protein